MTASFVEMSVFYIDAMHMKANTNKKKFDRVQLAAEARAYQAQLDAEIHWNREAHGKNPYCLYAVAVDAGYKTPAIAHLLREEDICPVMPYARLKCPLGRLCKQEFVYDAYLCPEHQALRYRTMNRNGYRVYVSDPVIYQSCPLLETCTQSRDHRKVILRHIWQDDLDEAEHLRHCQGRSIFPQKRRNKIPQKEA